jgi:hypothetical protein
LGLGEPVAFFSFNQIVGAIGAYGQKIGMLPYFAPDETILAEGL